MGQKQKRIRQKEQQDWAEVKDEINVPIALSAFRDKH